MDEKFLERIVHNHYIKNNGGRYLPTDILAAKGFHKLFEESKDLKLPKYKVGLMLISINENYWQYTKDMIEGVRKYFLPGHDTEIMLWTDMPKEVSYGVTRFEARSMPFPHPTLRRYELFLEQKEYLQKFDYLFFMDIDMKIINIIGDEMLGEGLTGAQHPMYALRQMFKAPYEQNPQSKAYVNVPQFYYAGGFQGGKADKFLEAMEVMQKNIEDDLSRNVIAKWNDESHWNRYLIDNPPSVVLSPSYVFPDSIIDEYYKKIWGTIYPPKIICLTKPFALTPQGQEQLNKELETLK